MITKNITYTSTLPAIIMNELSEYASTHNKKKNEVIIEAITNFLEERRKKHYADSFKRMRNDSEQKQLAEEGLNDFAKIIYKHEKRRK